MVALIEAVYRFLWGDIVTIPLPGGNSLGLSLLVILLIPTGIYFTVRTKFLPIRLFPDMVRALKGFSLFVHCKTSYVYGRACVYIAKAKAYIFTLRHITDIEN